MWSVYIQCTDLRQFLFIYDDERLERLINLLKLSWRVLLLGSGSKFILSSVSCLAAFSHSLGLVTGWAYLGRTPVRTAPGNKTLTLSAPATWMQTFKNIIVECTVYRLPLLGFCILLGTAVAAVVHLGNLHNVPIFLRTLHDKNNANASQMGKATYINDRKEGGVLIAEPQQHNTQWLACYNCTAIQTLVTAGIASWFCSVAWPIHAPGGHGMNLEPLP